MMFKLGNALYQELLEKAKAPKTMTIAGFTDLVFQLEVARFIGIKVVLDEGLDPKGWQLVDDQGNVIKEGP